MPSAHSYFEKSKCILGHSSAYKPCAGDHFRSALHIDNSPRLLCYRLCDLVKTAASVRLKK